MKIDPKAIEISSPDERGPKSKKYFGRIIKFSLNFKIKKNYLGYKLFVMGIENLKEGV